MTRDEAIALWRMTSLSSAERDFSKKYLPEVVEQIIGEMAQADIAGFIALGIIKVEET